MSIQNKQRILAEAAAQVKSLRDLINAGGGSEEPAYAALDEAIKEVEAASGEAVDRLLPATAERGLGFRRAKSGKNFWQVYREHILKEICNPRGKTYKMLKQSSVLTASAAVTAVVSALSLPLTAIPLAVPIAAMLLVKGLDAFCEVNRR